MPRFRKEIIPSSPHWPFKRVDIFEHGRKLGYVEYEYFGRLGKQPPFYFISYVHVVPKLRNRRLSRPIMSAIETLLKEKKDVGILLDGIPANHYAHGMYERRGWTKYVTTIGELYAYNQNESFSEVTAESILSRFKKSRRKTTHYSGQTMRKEN